jgi:hypothetical protein
MALATRTLGSGASKTSNAPPAVEKPLIVPGRIHEVSRHVAKIINGEGRGVPTPGRIEDVKVAIVIDKAPETTPVQYSSDDLTGVVEIARERLRAPRGSQDVKGAGVVEIPVSLPARREEFPGDLALIINPKRQITQAARR